MAATWDLATVSRAQGTCREKISPRPRPLTRPHGPGVATIAGGLQLRFLSTWSQLQTSHSCHALAQLRPAPACCSQPGSWSLLVPARPSNMFCAATTSSGFYHHEILFNTCWAAGCLCNSQSLQFFIKMRIFMIFQSICTSHDPRSYAHVPTQLVDCLQSFHLEDVNATRRKSSGFSGRRCMRPRNP